MTLKEEFCLVKKLIEACWGNMFHGGEGVKEREDGQKGEKALK